MAILSGSGTQGSPLFLARESDTDEEAGSVRGGESDTDEGPGSVGGGDDDDILTGNRASNVTNIGTDFYDIKCTTK